MRILDIGVAAGYGILCVSLISLLNPYSFDGGQVTAASDARASAALADYVQAVGLSFLANAPPSEICSSLQARSNGTVILGGSVDGSACGTAPVAFVGSSGFGFTVQGNQVEIEAWVEGR
jgi:hypothetical protein